MRGRALPLLPPLLLWLHALPPAPAAFAAASAAHLAPRNAPATATSTAPAPNAELDDAPANDSLLLVTPEPDLRNLTEGVPSGDPDPGGGGSTVPRGSSWGPRRDPLYIVIPMTVVYAAIFVAGLLGNVGTCVVIARNRHLHTATNYYLFSLAVSDLLLLLAGLPQEVYAIWSRYPYVFGEAFCVLQSYAAETSANATVLTITAFTVERYVAICHPFQAHAMSRLSRAVRFVLCIWLLALGLAVPQASQFGVVLERRADGTVLDADHAMCSVKRVLIPHAFEVSTFVFFVAPMTLITVLYVLIALKLRGSRVLAEGRRDACGSVRLKHGSSLRGPTSRGPGSRGQASCGGGGEAGADAAAANGRKNFSARGGPAHSAASRHVVKMLVAVVVAFFICWAPFHAQRLLAVYAYDPSLKPGHATVLLYQTLTYVSGVLYYLSTTVNPVLYHIMSHKFREAFKATLARYLGRGRRGRSAEGTSRRYSELSRRSSARSTTTTSVRLPGAAGSGAGGGGAGRPLVVSFRRRPGAAPAPAATCLSARDTPPPTAPAATPTAAPPPPPPPFLAPCFCARPEHHIEVFQEQQMRILPRPVAAAAAAAARSRELDAG